MTLSEEQRRRLAGRARTLQERLDAPATEPNGDGTNDWTVEDPDEWLTEWRERVADGDEAAFRRRLDRAGVSLDEARDRIRSNRWPPDRPVPAWVDRTDDLVSALDGRDPGAVTAPFEEAKPFEELLWAVTTAAADRLDERDDDVLTPAAHSDLREWLYERLHALAVHPLFVEFKTFVARRDRELVFGDPDVPGDQTRHYEDFLDVTFHGGFERFVLEYAFLARLLDAVVGGWVGAVEEFRRRLAADRTAIASQFGNGEDPGPIVGIDHFGDPHQGGRVVLRVAFESGTTVAYKPRDVGPEAAVAEICSWLDDAPDVPTLAALDCLERDGYGWIGWVEGDACQSTGDVASYYRRAGAMLCLCYALQFTDGHLENVVAAGDHPVVVDLETVAQPDLPPEKLPRSAPARDVIRDSVLRTGFVPVYRPDADARGASGFGSPTATAKREVPTFGDVNTDLMDMEYRESHAIRGENLPRLDGSVVEPDEYVGDLVEGFRDAYDALLDRREATLADGGPVDQLAGVETRVLYRDTGTYGAILSSLTTPEYLRTGLAFGCKVEALARPIVTGTTDDDCWPVYEAERAALARGDVPRFALATDDADLRCGERTIEEFVSTPPIQAVRRRIADLGPADREEQVDYLDLAYRGSTGTGRHHSPATGIGDPGSTDAGEQQSRQADEAGTGQERSRPPSADDPAHEVDLANEGRRIAAEIADRIQAEADVTADGDPVWYLREPTPDEGVHVHAVGDDLYHGRLGIATLFAGLWAATDDDERREFAERVAAPTYREATGDDPFPDRRIGACEGVGSVVYGLTTLGRLLDADRYLDAAGRAARTLTPDRIAEDRVYDVFGGSAGAVLGLLAHHRATGDRGSLERAVAAGGHLLDAADEDDGGPVWRGVDHDRWLTGFSHGSAGIAYALAHLWDATGESRFRETALDAVRRESRTYDPDARNWPDRRAGPVDFFDGWCNGRSGVGLARVGTDERIRDPVVREDVDRALAGADPGDLPPEDHLCCGTFGRVAFLRRAGRTVEGRSGRAAERLAALSVRRARDGGFPVRSGTDHWLDPTLFGGEAGVGYELLRFAAPSLPRLLLWE